MSVKPLSKMVCPKGFTSRFVDGTTLTTAWFCTSRAGRFTTVATGPVTMRDTPPGVTPRLMLAERPMKMDAYLGNAGALNPRVRRIEWLTPTHKQAQL